MSGVITPSGAKSKLGFGLQADWDTAAKATHLCEYRSGGATARRLNAYSTALRDTPSQKIKGQVADFEASGQVTVELTPEGTLPLLLTSMFGAPTTTTYYADVTGSPTTWLVGTTYAEDAKVLRNSYYYTSVAGSNVGNDPQYDDDGTYWTPVPDVTSGITANLRSYKHAWKLKWDQIYVSMAHLKGTTIEEFVRGLITSFSVGVSRGNREIITASVDARFANSFIASAWGDVASGGAGYDTLPGWTSAKAKVLIDDVVGASFREFNVGISRTISDKLVLNGKLGPAGFNHNAAETSGSLNCYFDSEENLYAFMGHSSAYTKPAGFTGELVYKDVKCVLAYATPGSGGSLLTYDSKLVFHFPNCLFGAVEQPIQGRDEIMQSITLDPCYDATEDTEVIIEVWNRQTNGSIVTTGAAVTVPGSAVE